MAKLLIIVDWYCRSRHLSFTSDAQQTVIDGGALRLADLLPAMQDVDGGLIAVSVLIDKITQQVVDAMQHAQITRLELVSSFGIYNECQQISQLLT